MRIGFQTTNWMSPVSVLSWCCCSFLQRKPAILTHTFVEVDGVCYHVCMGKVYVTPAVEQPGLFLDFPDDPFVPFIPVPFSCVRHAKAAIRITGLAIPDRIRTPDHLYIYLKLKESYRKNEARKVSNRCPTCGHAHRG